LRVYPWIKLVAGEGGRKKYLFSPKKAILESDLIFNVELLLLAYMRTFPLPMCLWQPGRIVVLFLFICLSFHAQAQIKDIRSMAPPSPSIGSLFKFSEVPVSLFTGIPEISVPLYSIKSNSVELPISLMYHAGGVKVAESASWVGMGWALNCGGVITQQVVGLRDDASPYGRLNKLFNISNPEVCDVSRVLDNFQDAQPDVFIFSFNGKSGKVVLDTNRKVIQIPAQGLKIEPSIPGTYPNYAISKWKITDVDGTQYFFEPTELALSRAYIVDDLGNVLNNSAIGEHPDVSSYSWLLAKVVGTSRDTISFEYEEYAVNDYYFNSETRYFIDPQASASLPLYYSSILKNYQYQIISGKRLKTIRFSGGRMEFVAGADRCDWYGDKYLDKIITYNTNNEKIKEQKLRYKYYVGNNIYDVGAINCTSEGSGINSQTFPLRRLFLVGVDEIDGAGAVASSYTFDYHNEVGLPSRFSAEQDLWGFYNKNGQNSLLGFMVKNGTTTAESMPRYDILGRNPDLYYAKQGTLKKVTYPTGGYSDFEYELNETYSTLESTIKYHPPITYTADAQNTNAILGQFSVNDYSGSVNMTFTIDPCVFGPNTMSQVAFSLVNQDNVTVVSGQDIVNSGGANPSSPYTFTIPNGSYKMLTYAAAPYPCNYTIKVAEWNERPPLVGIPKYGGLRINTIRNYDPVTAKNITRKYSYTEIRNGQEVSTGYPMIPTAGLRNDYVSYKSAGLRIVVPTSPFPVEEYVKVMTVGSNTNYPLGTNQNNFIGYEKVTEKMLGNNEEDLGYTFYEFKISPEDQIPVAPLHSYGQSWVSHTDRFPWAPVYSYSWARGQLLKKYQYVRTPAPGYQCIRKEENYYSRPYTKDTVKGFLPAYEMKSQSPLMFTYCPGGNGVSTSDAFIYTPYEIWSGYVLRDSSYTAELDANNNIIENKVSYKYNLTNMLPATVTTTNSKGEGMVEEMKYAIDYIAPGLTDNAAKSIKLMQDAYVVDKPIEHVVYNLKGTSKFMRSATFNTYNIDNFRPATVFRVENNGLIASFVPSVIQSGSVVKNAGYKPQHIFDRYDDKGNILEQHKENGLKEVYLWGYNKQYPVAHILGSDYNTVSGFINPSILNNPATDQQLRDEVNKIRIGLAGTNALVTSYSFNRLIGVSSTTDPAGKTTYYEYDGLGRLKLIKDQHGKILKQFDYQYKAPLQQ